MHDPARSLFLTFYETRGVHDNAAEHKARSTSSPQGFSALRPELTPATRSAMSSVTTMTRDEQKDLIREVLREQPPPASRAASPQPPQAKKQRLHPFFDEPRIRALSDRYQWDLEIYGPCDHCEQPKIWNLNFAGCCGCPDCRCPKCMRINERADLDFLVDIHEEVKRRRLWCLQTDWGDYNLNGYDSDEYHARDSGIVTDSSNDDDSDDDSDDDG